MAIAMYTLLRNEPRTTEPADRSDGDGAIVPPR
jgi:hypothetical protein